MSLPPPKPLPVPPKAAASTGAGAKAPPKPLPLPGSGGNQPKKKSPSLLSQLGSAAGMIAQLPVTIPASIVRAGVHAGQFGYDYLNPEAKNNLGTNDEINQKYFPEVTPILKSFSNFGGRVYNQTGLPTTHDVQAASHGDVGMHLPTGWKQNAAYYQDKIDKGEIVGAGIEDIGNVAMASGIGASILGKGGAFTAPLTATERAGIAGTGEVSGAGERLAANEFTRPPSIIERSGVDLERPVPATREMPPAGSFAPTTPLQPMWTPGKGLAGALEGGAAGPTSFMPGQAGSLASTLANAGDFLHSTSAGADTFFRPLKASGDLLESGAAKVGIGDISAYRPSNFVPKYAGEAVQGLVDNTKFGKAALSGLTTAGRAVSNQLSLVRERYAGDLLGATRQAMDPAMLARSHGLSDAQASAAMTVDNLFSPLMDTIRKQPGVDDWLKGTPNPDIEGLINRPYAGVATEGQRPTPEMIRELMNYESGATEAADPHMAATMDAVRQAQANVSGTRSERRYGSGHVAGDEVQVGTREVKDPVTGEVTTEPVMSTQYAPDKTHPQGDITGNEGGLVSPENYGDTLRPSVITENQAPLQKIASRLGTAKAEKYIEMAHEQRVNDSLRAIVDDLPAPPNVATERKFGKYTEREAVLRRDHASAVKDVERALDNYVTVSESETTPAAWADAQRRLDAANARAEKIRTKVETLVRRRDATVALSRASGEFKAGVPRTALHPGVVADDLRSEFQSLQGDDAILVTNRIKEEIASAVNGGQELSPQEAGDFHSQLFPRHSATDITNVLVNNNVSWYELANYILNGETTPSLRAIQETRPAGANVQLGRYAGELKGLQAALPGINAEENAAVASLAKAAKQGEAAEAAAAKTLSQAQRREAWLNERRGRAESQIPTDASEVKNPWRSYQGADGEIHASKAVRQQQMLAVSDARLRRVQQEYHNISRSYDRAQWKVGNVPVELGRKFQVRLVEDVNSPALGRADRAAGTGMKTFGEVKGLSGEGSTGKPVDPYITGHVGTMAAKYGVSNELLDAVMAHMTKKADDLGLDISDKANWTDPALQLEPVELAQAFHDAMDINGKKMEDWEAKTFDDYMHSAQMRYGMRGVAEAQGVTSQARPGIPDTSGTGTDVPGGATYEDRPNGEVLTGKGGKAMQAPFAVHEYMNDYLKDQWKNPPQEVINAVNDSKRSYLDSRDRFLSRKMDEQARAIPAPFRGIHQIAKLHIKDLLDQATKLNEAKPGSGDVYAEMAWDVSSGLDEMVAAGISPQHMIGGPELDPTHAGGGGRTGGIGGRRKAKAANLKTTGFREVGIDAYARVEAKDLRDWMLNKRDQTITTAFAKKSAEIPALQQKIDEARATGRDLSGRDIQTHALEEGWVPVKSGDAITADTQWIPQRVDRSMRFDNFWDSDNPIAVGLRGIHWANSMWKQFLLGLSPKWVMGNVLGMTLAATVHGGLGPGEFLGGLARNVTAQGGLRETWRNEGLLPELPGPLSSSGLTANEFKIAYDIKAEELNRAKFDPRRVPDAIKSVTYPGNEVFDNLSKSTVYLSKLKDGMPRDAALKSTLDAMGNYNNMSVFERRVMREVFPFYAWMRQSSKAMLRLPYVSPMRAAMVYSIGTAMMDPDVTTDVMAIIGSRFQLGAGSSTFFDMGSFNPNADLSEDSLTAFDPRNLGRALSPAIKYPIKWATGINPDTMLGSTRPNDTYDTGLYDQKVATPPWLVALKGHPLDALGEVAWDVKNTTPLTRNLADFAYGNEARYGGTGYPIKNLPPNPNITWPRSLLKAAQLPSLYTTTSPKVSAYVANQVKKAG